MEKLKRLLLNLSAGMRLDEAWPESNFGSREEAVDALRALAGALGSDGSGGAARPGGSMEEESDVNGDPLESIVVYVDGASRGNPGPSSIAAVAYHGSGELLTSIAKTIGRATNNVAEYRAVIEGAKLARKLGARNVVFRLDSELVVKQLNGHYRIKDGKLKLLSREVIDETGSFESCRYEHIPRDQNFEADRLANDALDGK
jgi:ribonuclease HI/probable phosphoglycerate mutase